MILTVYYIEGRVVLLFSDAQINAINHFKGPAMVLAGPGSGKTTVITHRIKNLITKCGVSPAEILVITFTRAAAVQMKERFLKLSDGLSVPVTFGTFHAVYFTIIKHAYNYQADCIVKPFIQNGFIRELIARFELEFDDEEEAVSLLLSEISRIKTERTDIESYESRICPPVTFRKIYKEYCDFLERKRLIDFDDMILICFRLLSERKDIKEAWQNKYKYILIDEFQDINRLQFEVINLIAAGNRNIFIVGDDDQSIYGFRGAVPDIMRDFERIYNDCSSYYLNVNYRCDGNVVTAARRLIDNNKNRFMKDIRTGRECKTKVNIILVKDTEDECEYIVKEIERLRKQDNTYSGIAVISRTNAISRNYKRIFDMQGIPCICSDKCESIYEHWIVKDIISYIRIALGSRERQDFIRIINKPVRYIKRVYLDNPVDLCNLEACYKGNDSILKNISDFRFDIGMIRNMSAFATINYIFKGIGYEEYIDKYVKEHHINEEEVQLIISTLTKLSGNFGNIKEFLQYIEKEKEALENADMNEQGNKNNDKGIKEGVELQTMHHSKGLEYNTVFITDVCENIVPYKKAVLPQEIEEERRMFYVAMTRAKERLYIISPAKRYNRQQSVSRFIEEIMGDNKESCNDVCYINAAGEQN